MSDMSEIEDNRAELSGEMKKLQLRNSKELKQLMTYYNCAMLEIETKFRVLSQEFSLEQDYNPIETIKSRLKSMDSIVEKLQRKNLPLELESIENNLKDVAGIRVICPFLSDIYRMASCLMEQDDILLIEKKDYIKNPKPNGYRSLHLIVETPIFLQKEKRMMKVEVQFRTIAMDFWASLEHRMHYKKNLDDKMQEMLVAELRDCAEESANLDIRMETVKDYIGENTEKSQKYS
ncbi:MAG: GTP pyrophosphokinase family protein [Lachnospiraceae bacterium]|nr:GTP pyrophosphokinase family protein [Lachnospiraceae bacterium]